MYNSKASIYEKMIIQSADGSKTADISGGAFIVTYYENLFSPMITAKIVVINTGDAIADKNGKMTSLYNGFPLRGGERVVLKIAGNSKINKEGLDFSKNSADYFYVASITNVLIDSQRETFTLNLVPREAITNETTRVGKKFPASQPISDSVQNIIKDYLKSDKVNLIDKTQNPYGFIGNLKKPFTILTWLSSKGVPESSGKDSSAGYLFYQTKDGFNFRSIDDLISQEPYEEKFVYTPNVVDFQDPRNNFKILDYGTNKNQDLIGKLESFERIHRSNLIGMGVLPLQFVENMNRQNLNLKGSELISVLGLEKGINPGDHLEVEIKYATGDIKKIKMLCRIDTKNELEYYKNGGILQYVLRNMINGWRNRNY